MIALKEHFGALSMSLTSTARKAITLFLSFLIFPKACTAFHVLGMSLFMLALVLKSNALGGSAPDLLARLPDELAALREAVCGSPTVPRAAREVPERGDSGNVLLHPLPARKGVAM